MRGLVIGMVGAFVAAGAVIGLGYPYITETLHGGNAGWGLVFAAIFIGIALGMLPGTRFLKDFSRRRLFGVAIVCAAIPLAIIALVPNLVIVIFLVVLIGTMARYRLRHRVHDRRPGGERRHPRPGVRLFHLGHPGHPVRGDRGRALPVQGASPSSSPALTGSGNVKIGNVVYTAVGQNVVLLLAALLAAALGISAYRHMDDRRGLSLWADLVAAIRGEPLESGPAECR